MLLVQVCHTSLSLFTPNTLPTFLVKNIVKLKSPTLSTNTPRKTYPLDHIGYRLNHWVESHTGFLEREPSYCRCR